MAAFAQASARMPADLWRRTATALVLGVVAAAALWAGGVAYYLVVMALFFGLLWEWDGLTLHGARRRVERVLLNGALWLAIATLTFQFDIAGIDDPFQAASPVRELLFGLDAVLLGVGLFVWLRALRVGVARGPLWKGAPNPLLPNILWPLWLAPAAFAALWLRQDYGIGALLLPCLAVIANDVGGYAFGRAIGGPKLAPRISPAKTWSGFAGGLLAALAAGLGVAAALGWSITPALALATLLTAVAGAGGDLAESALKRGAGVKDSGRLLPGHGGLFDRLDGHVLALPTFALYLLLQGGPA